MAGINSGMDAALRRSARIALVTVTVIVLTGTAGFAAGAPNNGSPSLTFAPSSPHDFGTVPVGQSRSQTFTVTNVGGRASRALTLTSSGDRSFTVTHDLCTGTSLGPNKSCTFTATFAPTSSGTVHATVKAAGVKAVASAPLSLSGNGTKGATAISAGITHTCALVTGGTVDCWGNNFDGALGNATNTDSNVPVAVSGLRGVLAISALGHTCALVAGRTVDCWGFNRFGELGNGTNTDSNAPVAVSGLRGVLAISAGGNHTCALVAGGTVDCWGLNNLGQLGNGTNTDSNVPVAVNGLSGVIAISAGDAHACALVAGGTVDCWGWNGFGQLGDGTNTFVDSNVPVVVSGLHGVLAISAGGSHTCALVIGGTLECWGDNFYGQLGNNATTPGAHRLRCVDVPVAVKGLSGVLGVSAGGLYTCALVTGRTVDCWGSNGTGQLGNGTNTDSNVPVAVNGLSRVIAISAGDAHACALVAGGTVDCWGDNFFGELGNATNTNSNVPVPVAVLP